MAGGDNTSKDTMQMALSIILAAAVAQALHISATSTPENNLALWLVFSISIILVAIAIISYVLDIHIFKDNKDPELFLKIMLITMFTLLVFSFSRFITFYSNETANSTNIITMYLTMSALGMLMGIILSIKTYSEWKNKTENWHTFLSYTILIFIIFGFILSVVELVMQLRGVGG